MTTATPSAPSTATHLQPLTPSFSSYGAVVVVVGVGTRKELKEFHIGLLLKTYSLLGEEGERVRNVDCERGEQGKKKKIELIRERERKKRKMEGRIKILRKKTKEVRR